VSNERWSLSLPPGRALVLLGLFVAALFGNYFSLPLFTGFNYLFGSIAVMLVVRLYGTVWGVVAGLFASTWTITLFGHPYAMIWLTCEPLVVGLLLRRGTSRNIILYDALYWPFLGAPLIWIVFRHVMHVPQLGTVAALLMYWVIGVGNALFASLLLTWFPRLALPGGTERASRTIPINALLFNLLMAIVMAPSIMVMIIHGKDADERHMHEMFDGIDDSGKVALYETRLRLQGLLATLGEGARLVQAHSASQRSLDELKLSIELMLKTHRDFQLVYAGDSQGRALAYAASGSGHAAAGDFSDREYFKRVRDQRRPVISDAVLTRGTDPQPTIALAVPALAADGTFLGYAAGGINLGVLAEIMTSARNRPHLHLTLVDGKGMVIVSTRKEHTPLSQYVACPDGMLGDTADAEIKNCLPNAAVASPLWQRAGKSRFLKRIDVGGGTPWSLVVESPFEPYQEILFSDHIKSLFVVLCLNTLALATSLVTSRRLSAPLRQLSQVTTDLPDRLLREKIETWPDSRIAEIDQLIANFRTMSGALNQRFQEISYANETLELRVSERTRELSEANLELHREIGERKATERQRDHLMDELVHQLRFLQTLIDAIPNPIFYKDANGTYQGCNRSFEEKWGLPREMIVGKSDHDLFPKQEAALLAAADEELFELRGVQIYETQMHYSDGEMHTVVFYKATYDDTEGRLAGLVGTVVDISKRKQAEAERDHLMTELRQKNKELEGIVYVASHDLRSPLVNVQGFSRKLAKNCAELAEFVAAAAPDGAGRERLAALVQEQIPKSLGFIIGSVEKMDALLTGLLRLSRLGRAAVCFESLDMNLIMAKIADSIAYQAESAGAVIEVAELAPCAGDSVQVTQVFSNLVDNALKYRSERTPHIRIFSEPASGSVRYCVEDNGIGIAPEQQERIWEIFQRLNQNDVPGEGLGLTLARRIVDRLEGRIWVESSPGAGSRFWVELPGPRSDNSLNREQMA